MEETTSKNEFTVGMALVDYFPVVTFCLVGVLLFIKVTSPVLLIGAIISTIAGLMKATWKLIMAIKNVNHTFMTKIFHIFLPAGFVLMLLSVPFHLKAYGTLCQGLFAMPSLVFMILFFCGMTMMIVFSIVLESRKGSSNWIEQLTNTVSQIFFALAILFVM